MGNGATPNITQMDNVLRPIRDYARPPSATQPVTKRPAIQTNNFELESITLQLLQGVQLTGLPHEDLNAYNMNFLEVCDTMKYNGVSDDAIHLWLFPFSFKDKTKHCLTMKPPDSITS